VEVLASVQAKILTIFWILPEEAKGGRAKRESEVSREEAARTACHALPLRGVLWLSIISYRLPLWLLALAVSGRSETDLDPRIWFLRIHDYGLVWLHIHELVIDLFYGFQGKFLVFSHFELPAPAPGINESGH
jgi:hypothetical protein